MKTLLFKYLFSAVALALACGCAERSPSTQPADTPSLAALSQRDLRPADPKDPQPPVNVYITIDVYQFDVPAGTISNNEAFWKRVDEFSADPRAARRLYDNGIRVGTAPRSEWPFFKAIFDRSPNDVRKMNIAGVHGQSIELPLSKPVEFENLFFIDADGSSTGRTYENCTNLLTIGFRPAPRRPDCVRITLCPAVRSPKTRLDYSVLNQEFDTPYLSTDRLYDLGLAMDILPDRFLIVSPSPAAQNPLSLGAAFLMSDAPAESMEHALLIVPTVFKVLPSPAP